MQLRNCYSHTGQRKVFCFKVISLLSKFCLLSATQRSSMFLCRISLKFINFFQDWKTSLFLKGNRKKIQGKSEMIQQLCHIPNPAVGFPIGRVKNPILEKSQMNTSCAASNSVFKGLWFCWFDIYTFVRATVIQTSSVSTDSYLYHLVWPSCSVFFKRASCIRRENLDLAFWMVIRASFFFFASLSKRKWLRTQDLADINAIRS